MHDIGKCTESFQKYIVENQKKTKKKTNGKYIRHNIIGYIFLKTHTTLPDEVCRLVLWHHTVDSDVMGKTGDKILKYLTAEDIDEMISFTKKMGFGDYIIPYDIKRIPEKLPGYFQSKHNDIQTPYMLGVDIPDFLMALELLITSDRCASSRYTNNYKSVEDIINKTSNMRFDDMDFSNFDNERIQKTI